MRVLLRRVVPRYEMKVMVNSSVSELISIADYSVEISLR
jgi:hypothetical protein